MSDKIKLVYVGDSPFINSGFGVVARSILTRLPRDEFDICVLGTMYPHHPESIEPYKVYRPVCKHDPMGFESMIEFIMEMNADVMFFIGDPGTLRTRFSNMAPTGQLGIKPQISYFPIEGLPLSAHHQHQARMAFDPVTYTKWGKQVFQDLGINVDFAYHGVDHADFRQFSEGDRQRLRELVGWQDKFVVGLIGVNKRTNRQPAMIEAARVLKDRGHDDVIIYLHCQNKGDLFMAGWELDWMFDHYDVRDMIVLKPNQAEHMYLGRPVDGENPTLDKPENLDQAMANLARLDFISLLNLFDLYVDPASAHGWNLPASEAARCGVPIVTVNDGFARAEIFGPCAHMMEPSGWDYWHTGAHLPLVSPKRIADTIEMFKEEPSRCKNVGLFCKERFDKLGWQTTADLFAEKFRIARQYGMEIAEQLV
jgi:glycosyltransferase involved in cell wall biosynthesis